MEIEQRKSNFIETLRPFVDTYGKEMLNDFYMYWTEPSKSGKLRFEGEQYWDLNRRLLTWKRLSNGKYAKQENGNNRSTGAIQQQQELASLYKHKTP